MGQRKSLWFILIEAPNDALKTSQLGDESQSFSLISQRGQPADSNRFQQIRNGPSFCCHQSQWQLFWQLFIFRGPRKDSHVCLESPSPKHWISLDITGYHWISLDITGYWTSQWYDLIQSDTIWYWYKQQFSQGTLPSPSISGRVHAPHAREDAPSRPPARHLKR